MLELFYLLADLIIETNHLLVPGLEASLQLMVSLLQLGDFLDEEGEHCLIGLQQQLLRLHDPLFILTWIPTSAGPPLGRSIYRSQPLP